MNRGRSAIEDPFLSPRWEFAANTIAAFTLLGILLRHGYQLSLPPWLLFCAVLLERAAVVMLLARLPERFRQRRLRRGTWFDWTIDLIFAAVALIAAGYHRPSTAAGVAVARQAVVAIRMLPRWDLIRRFLTHLQIRPWRVLAISFLVTILAGTALLTLPAATADGSGAPFLTALFTSTSAVCVTGLIVVDTGTYFSRFGQWTILALIQVGGLGIMTLSTSVFLLFGRRLGLRTRSVMQHLQDETSVQGLVSLVRHILVTTILIESLGVAALWFSWRDLFPEHGERLFASLFHSVSAFCNAGFSLFSDSLAGVAGRSAGAVMTVAVLIIIGGLGFTVIAAILNLDLIRKGPGRTFRRLNTQSRLVFLISAVLLVAGTLAIYYFEFDHSLEPMPGGRKLLSAFFLSVTARTAGFNNSDPAGMLPATVLLTIILMFIGAAPGSTGGGIKVTTLGVLVLSVRAMLRGREDVEFSGRTIPKSTVYRAMVITVISAAVVLAFLLILLATQRGGFQVLLFETVSAFANVGLSLGATTKLNALGQVLVILLMYIGRLGPLTLTLAIAESLEHADFRYPEARLMVG